MAISFPGHLLFLMMSVSPVSSKRESVNSHRLTIPSVVSKMSAVPDLSIDNVSVVGTTDKPL